MNQREISSHRERIIRDLLARNVRQVDIAKILRTTPGTVGVVAQRIRAKDAARLQDAAPIAGTGVCYPTHHDPNDPD